MAAQQVYLIPFCDDSTLIFATRMRSLLVAAGAKVDLAIYQPELVLSARQIRAHLPDLDYGLLTQPSLIEAATSGRYDAIVTSRVYRTLNNLLRQPGFRLMPRRAQIISFLGGLDFFPEKGRANRRNCDAIYLFPKPELAAFDAEYQPDEDRRPPLVRFGHPAFLMPDAPGPQKSTGRDIYFFAQAISPITRASRVHMLRAMAAIARANPDRGVWIKLRHLPTENTRHLHREQHDYPSLFAELGAEAPPNLQLTDCTMEQALENTAIGITCTSTAAIDLIREGIATIVHLDYVDNFADPLAEPMRQLFAQSGLITSLDDMLHLRAARPDRDWIEAMFCGRDLGHQVIETVSELKALPAQG